MTDAGYVVTGWVLTRRARRTLPPGESPES